VFVHGPPKVRLTYDIEELKRLLILLAAALVLNRVGPLTHEILNILVVLEQLNSLTHEIEQSIRYNILVLNAGR